MMQFTIILEGSETPVQLAKVRAAVNAYCDASSKSTTMELELRVDSAAAMAELERFKAAVGDLEVPESVGEKLEVELLNKLEAENPQFGQQPLPPGAAPISDAEGLGMPGAPLLPLASSGAPSPAAAETSASAPADAPVSIPPPPSAASSVPSPPAAAVTPSPAAAVEVDKNGLPWDERIHASSRVKIADGSWRMKRGVEPALIAQVEAQLRAQIPPAAPPTTFAEAPPAGAPVPPPPTAPLPPGPPALTFGIVAKRIGAAVTAGTLSGNVLSVKLAELGFPDGLHTVNARPDMWQKILDTLGA
ncbi:MAG TPA: hypothetical protein VFS02_22400 [Telluria sp.]|nr:hypothetical protein [Telluria sp.]